MFLVMVLFPPFLSVRLIVFHHDVYFIISFPYLPSGLHKYPFSYLGRYRSISLNSISTCDVVDLFATTSSRILVYSSTGCLSVPSARNFLFFPDSSDLQSASRNRSIDFDVLLSRGAKLKLRIIYIYIYISKNTQHHRYRCPKGRLHELLMEAIRHSWQQRTVITNLLFSSNDGALNEEFVLALAVNGESL